MGWGGGDWAGSCRLNHRDWTVGNEEALGPLKQERTQSNEKDPPLPLYGRQPAEGAGPKKGSLRLEEPLGGDVSEQRAGERCKA